MIKTACHLFIVCLFVGYGCRNSEVKNYRVKEKNSANFSVFVSMLYPKEHLLVKVNGDLILDQVGENITGSPTAYNHFHYPDSIKTIEVTSQYNGKVLFKRLFIDTLVNIAQRSVIISRPFPKGMTKENYKPYGYVSIDSSDRTITLINDAVYYKGTLRY